MIELIIWENVRDCQFYYYNWFIIIIVLLSLYMILWYVWQIMLSLKKAL